MFISDVPLRALLWLVLGRVCFVWAAVRGKLAQNLEQASALLAASSRARSQVFFSAYAATRAPADPAVICAQPELANFRLLGAVRLLGEH